MSAYGHSIRRVTDGTYVLTWCWDKKYAGSRLRYPQSIKRITDRKGAERFAKKWRCMMPEDAR